MERGRFIVTSETCEGGGADKMFPTILVPAGENCNGKLGHTKKAQRLRERSLGRV